MMNRPVWRAWALTLMWMAVIALESFSGSAQNTGRLLYPVLKFFFPHIKFLRMFQIHFLIRKTGHFLGYSVLSFTLYRAWWTTWMARVAPGHLSWHDMFCAWSGRAALLALLCTLAVASADELHQSFSPGRTAAVSDVMLDESGGILAQSLIIVISSVAIARRKRSRVQHQPVTSA